jgi:hypothetical protein
MTEPRLLSRPPGTMEISEVELRFFLDDPIPDEALDFTPDDYTNYKLSRTPAYASRHLPYYHWFPAGPDWQGKDKFLPWWPPGEDIPNHHPEFGLRKGTPGIDDPRWARERWRLAEPTVLFWWKRNRPGTRPSRWWVWSAPELRPKGESELDYLRRHGLLDKVEEALLARAGD